MLHTVVCKDIFTDEASERTVFTHSYHLCSHSSGHLLSKVLIQAMLPHPVVGTVNCLVPSLEIPRIDTITSTFPSTSTLVLWSFTVKSNVVV